jgi:hypothetical protein
VRHRVTALPAVTSRILISDPASNGLATAINLQMVGDTRYYDAAGFPGRTVGLSTTALPNATQAAQTLPIYRRSSRMLF